MQYSFKIPMRPVPKKNSRPILKNKKTGKPFLGKSEELKQAEETLVFLLNAQKNCQGIKDPISVRCHVSYCFDLVGDKEIDYDNMIAFTSDGLEHAGVIKNDKLFRKGTWDINYGCKSDLITVVITVPSQEAIKNNDATKMIKEILYGPHA